MNFFTIGFVFCSMNFNIGYPANYIVRVVGALFMLGGISETRVSEDSSGFGKFRGDVLLTLGCSVIGTVLTFLTWHRVIPEKAGAAAALAAGTLTFVSVLFHQYRIITHMRPMKALVNDPSLLEKLFRAWRGYAVASSVTMLCQIVMRLAVSGGTVHAAAGGLFFITIIVQYVLLVHLGGAINDVRTDYNVMHPLEPSERPEKRP
ncbi:hypothetical protein SAMN02910447_00858 [Ruminococcus sp. YE71]|uniref:hypothetical protein n=1 Tax=unclassified Ruminococcus TaxID=2608920 RepID=UPI0008879272|nr:MULTISPECIES: hypothetical protein [unclassified Ruminococcus]SDA14534.1 hypothetical protein SAMN02910446_00857 [Ruminococcus sp. YE78]SFW21163.1 hypothetical protein SAMN02910447_00858 [Ruminococcus sp. YE71]